MILPRVGHGFDVHAFADPEQSGLIIGGIAVPDEPALSGHSDGDVVLHAVVDALLSTIGGGDIGRLVGVDRPETAGADSAEFVAVAYERLNDAGYRPYNVAVTIVAQRPRLGAHLDRMGERIIELLHLPVEPIPRVNVAATTTDRLGSIGAGEGIACWCAATVVPSTL